MSKLLACTIISQFSYSSIDISKIYILNSKPTVNFTNCNSYNLLHVCWGSWSPFLVSLWLCEEPEWNHSILPCFRCSPSCQRGASGPLVWHLSVCLLSSELICVWVDSKVITRLPFCFFIVPQMEAKTPQWAPQMTTLTTPPVKSTRWETQSVVVQIVWALFTCNHLHCILNT